MLQRHRRLGPRPAPHLPEPPPRRPALLCSFRWPTQQCQVPPEACFYAHGTWELRQDVSQQAQQWRAQQPGLPARPPACRLACLPGCSSVSHCQASCMMLQQQDSHGTRRPTCLAMSARAACPSLPSCPLALPLCSPVMHELPAGSSVEQVLHKTQPCIDFLQLGSCPAGDACRCAHSAAELQPRPLPTPTLRAWLERSGLQLPGETNGAAPRRRWVRRRRQEGR